MSLKNAIHRYWGNTQSLTSVVDIDNVITGKVPDDLIVRPFVVISDAYDSMHDTSDVIVQEHTVTFSVTADSDETVETVIQTVEREFDDTNSKPRMHLDGGEELIAAYPLSASVDEPEPGTWTGVVTFRFLVGTLVEAPTT